MKKKRIIYHKPKIKSKKIKLNLFFSAEDQYGDFFSAEQFQGQILACCGTCWSCSDKTFKKKIIPLKNVLPKIEKIHGVSFQWNTTNKIMGMKADQDQIGVIAQEVEQVFPELVASWGERYKAVDYAKLSAVLIEAVKELKKENNLMKKRIDQLERK